MIVYTVPATIKRASKRQNALTRIVFIYIPPYQAAEELLTTDALTDEAATED